MAIHRRPKQPSYARVVVLTAAAAAAVALSGQGAWADPAPSVGDVKAQMDGLNSQAERATELYDGAKEKADGLRRRAAGLQDEVARTQAQVDRLEEGLASVAGQQYMQDGLDPSVQLMLSADPSGYLDRATTQHEASVSEAGALKALQQSERTLNQQKQDAAAALAQLDSTTTALNGAKAQVQAKLQQSQSLLNSLTAGQRAALLAAQQDAEGGEASRGSTRADLASLPQASGQAGVAVQAALSRLGDPYLWGAGGPSAFDCSGLTQWAYGQAGIQLPRTSQEQATVGIAVPGLAQARPGDLVIYNAEDGPEGHVGLYIGNGQVVHAPHAGAVVRIMQANAMSIATIRRV
ncbi:cell wall-associated NlpC family hydrolase [Kitasatospora sp. MAA4]|uniref:C40 family peptidase n=1 Tax=Kitasatospora sp. MAA4 TaxID=3035093 RepID=UPI002475A505|nr:C40 family peptidase [Kitasatospora sp. MAA4]MDH6137902.1 cell wall-associated NlpC family hydrolase [Kitasatospora sp. MAA4]